MMYEVYISVSVGIWFSSRHNVLGYYLYDVKYGYVSVIVIAYKFKNMSSQNVGYLVMILKFFG